MRFIILAPTYRGSSAGVRFLYDLQKKLILAGEDAQMMDVNRPYITEKDDIVCYPEIIPDNPLRAKKVVRFILAPPPASRRWKDSNLKVAYHPEYSKEHDMLMHFETTEPFFTDMGYERTMDAFYIGKGAFTNYPELDNAREITHQWPKFRKTMAHLLNKCKTLYLFDTMTILREEAVLCGVPNIKLVDDEGIKDYPEYDRYKYDLPIDEQINEFIEACKCL